MKILYFGSACDQEWFNHISQTIGMPSIVAQYKFETALLDGLSCVENIDLTIYYVYQQTYYPKGKYKFIKSKIKTINEKLSVTYINTVYFPIIKEFSFFLAGIFLTLKWMIKNNNEPEKIILTPFHYTPLALGILLIAKIFRIKRVNIFTDLSTDILNTKRQKEMILLKKIILPHYKKIVSYLENSYDLYILFTEPMNEKVNRAKKPYIVIEGICDCNLDLTSEKKEKALMYAGTLSYEYGVIMILDAFEQIDDDTLQLWLFGEGDMHDYIVNLCERDKRVKFFGFMPHSEVFKYEKRATLLVNTRNPNDTYTRYSFPSKTFEYMLSGTPYLTTYIKGIPEEYYKYLLVVDQYDVNLIKKNIIKIFKKPKSELILIGEAAQNFIKNSKNQVVQANKIIQFIKKYNY